MSSEENKRLARQAYDAMARHDLDAFEKMLDSNFMDHNPDPGQTGDLAGTLKSFREFFAAFPDMRMTVGDQVAEGDLVVSRLTMTGTNSGSFMGMPATGKRVTVDGIDMVRVKDGKAVERWGQFDNLGMMQQLGLIPAP